MEIIAKSRYPLTEEELKKLTEIVDYEEYFQYYPIHWQSGAWSESKVTFIGRKIIRFTVSFGVHNGEENWRKGIRADINRETMTFMEN